MANSEFTVRVKVQGGADVEAIKKALAGLGAEVTRTGSRVKGANKDQTDFFDTQKKGIIGTANSTKSFSKLAETIGNGGSSGLVGAYATLAANVFAVSAAFNALRGASQVEQIFKGLEASGARTGKALTVAAAGLREVTGDAINMEQALRSTAQISSAGFGSETIKRLGEAAKDASFALGRNMTDSLDRLTRGVVKLEPELLDELGIMTKLTESNTKYAATLGKSETQLTNYEKRQGFLNAVLAEAELKFGGLSEAAGDSKNYDVLASSVTNLTNSTLGALNTVFRPLAGLLASSPMALVGVFTIFASTLAKQLLPGLASTVVRTQAAALAALDHAAAIKASTAATIAQAKATDSNFLANLKGLAQIDAAGPKVFTAMSAKIKDGTASARELAKVINSLESKNRIDRAIMVQNPAYATPSNPQQQQRADEKTATIALTQQRIDAIRAIAAENTNAAARNLAQQKTITEANLRSSAASRQAAAAQGVAAAVGAASTRNYIGAVKELVTATGTYATALKKTQMADKLADTQKISMLARIKASIAEAAAAMAALGKATGEPLTGMNKLRVAGFAAGAAIKTIGSGFLAAIPILGQVLFAFSLVKMAVDYFTSDKTKEFRKGFNDLQEILKSTTASLKEMERTNSSTADAALRTERSLTIQSNAISTLVDGYQKLLNIKEKVNKEDPESTVSSGARAFFLNDKRDTDSYQTGVARGSEALKAGADKLGGYSLLGGQDKMVTASIQTLDKLIQLAPEATKAAVNMRGGFQALTKTSAGDFVKTVNAIADTINGKYKEAADRVTSLVQSFKTLNEEIGSFALSAQGSTPFDGVVKGFDAAINGINRFKIASATLAAPDTTAWRDLLQGIGANTEKFLTTETKAKLDSLRATDAETQALEHRVELGETLTKKEQARLGVLKTTIVEQRSALLLVERDLRVTQERFDQAQRYDRVLKSQLSVLQATMSANSANYAATGVGIAAQMRAENQVLQIQGAQLKNQQSILEGYINQAKTQIQAQSDVLKGEIALLAARNNYNKSINEGNVSMRLQAASLREQAAATRIQGSGGNVADILKGGTARQEQVKKLGLETVVQYENLNKTVETLNKTALDMQGIREAQQSIEGYSAAIENLSNQRSALATAESTAAQQAAAEATKQTEIMTKRRESLIAQKAMVEDTNDAYAKTSALLNGSNDDLRTQIKLLNQTNDRAKVRANDEYASQMATLRAQIQSAEADSVKAVSDDQKAASKARLDNLGGELNLLNQGYAVQVAQLDATGRLAILEKVVFDTRKEGLDWQQQSLDMVQKQIDAQKQLADEIQNSYELRIKAEAKRGGYEISQAGDDSIDIKAAEAAYKFAVQEISLKKGMIDLQFALLDAQKAALAEELRTRRDNLDPNVAQNQVRIAQLDATINKLENVDLTKAANAATAALDVGLKNARTTLETALAPRRGNTVFTQMFGDIQGILQRRDAAMSAQRTLETARPEDSVKVVRAESQAQREIMRNEVANPIVSSNDKLILSINAWIAAIDKLLAVQAITSNVTNLSGDSDVSVNRSAPAMLQTIVDFFTKKGYTVAQAAGIAGNLQQESGLNAKAVNRESGMAGLAQFSKRNQAEFFKEYGHGIAQSTVNEQLEFINKQLNGTEGAAKKMLLAANSVAEAAVAFRKGYERPGEAEAQDAKRIKYAQNAVVANAAPRTPVVATNAPVAVAPPQVPSSEVTAEASKTKQTPVSVLSADLNVPAPKVDWSEPIANLTDQLKDVKPVSPKFGVKDTLDAFNALSSATIENLKALGPDGEVVATLASGMSSVASGIDNVFDAMTTTTGDAAKDFGNRVSAIAGAASAALSTIQGVLSSSAQAKEDAIQREIDAETKRDGKSAESLAKIASLDKQKDAIARKQFNTNKKLMMAQAVIGTAAGVAQALGSGLPFPANVILAGVIGAMGAAQLGIIAGTSYQSSAATATAGVETPTLSIGKTGDSVDLAKQNTNVGGELGYLRGKQGTGTNSGNYSVIGSAYGGDLPRGYGNTAYVVGEKGPETIEMSENSISVRPANDNNSGAPVTANFHINAIDASGVEDVLMKQQGNLIRMFRSAANANGQPFMEDVNTNVYSRPNATGNSRL